MKKEIDIKKLVENFYDCFDKENNNKGGKEFERFVKIFLSDIGFEDIEITGRPNDGGVDLCCYKYTIPGSNELQEKYIVQAKKYNLKTKVKSESIAYLQSNEKGSPNGRIFITTSDFSKKAKIIAKENSKPVILINGEDIVNFYINNPEKDVMIEWIPKISKDRIKQLIAQEENINDSSKIEDQDNLDDYIPKPISRNDIRARILPIPPQIYEQIQDKDSFDVECLNVRKKLKINKARKYFGGITDFYKNAGYIGYSGEENKKSQWKLSKDKSYIMLKLL